MASNQWRGRRAVQILVGLIALGILVEAILFAAVCACSLRKYPDTPADCVIVLGARVWPDGVVSNALGYRLDAALEAYEKGLVKKIITTGARGGDEPIAEAIASRDYLMARGVPEEDILMDPESYDTVQNLQHAKRIMAENGLTTALLCTSDYHITRSMWIVGEVGIDASPLPAESPKKPVTWVMNRVRETISWVLYGMNRIWP